MPSVPQADRPRGPVDTERCLPLGLGSDLKHSSCQTSLIYEVDIPSEKVSNDVEHIVMTAVRK